jgi:hypothetical protein
VKRREEKRRTGEVQASVENVSTLNSVDMSRADHWTKAGVSTSNKRQFGKNVRLS